MYLIDHYELAEQRVVGLTVGTGCTLRVSHGRLWLTQPGQHQDLWLQPGESWTQATTGLVWLSAEPSARFQLAHPMVAGSAARRFTRLTWPRLRALATTPAQWRRSQAPRLATLEA